MRIRQEGGTLRLPGALGSFPCPLGLPSRSHQSPWAGFKNSAPIGRPIWVTPMRVWVWSRRTLGRRYPGGAPPSLPASLVSVGADTLPVPSFGVRVDQELKRSVGPNRKISLCYIFLTRLASKETPNRKCRGRPCPQGRPCSSPECKL